MKKLLLLLLLFANVAWAQNQWHVRPFPGHEYDPSGGDGSETDPWTLHEALTNTVGIQPGDTVWLHGGPNGTDGIYKGHFVSELNGNADVDPYDQVNDLGYITVSGYPGERAIIDGNIYNNGGTNILPIDHPFTEMPAAISRGYILEAKGKFVKFMNFQVTCLGYFERFNRNGCPDNKFRKYVGIQHVANKHKFINLVVNNIPGIGMGSWGPTGDTEIYGCLFYYNGQLNPKAGTIPSANCATFVPTTANSQAFENCIYTQNKTDRTRQIINNIFLNNFQSGVGVWSASTMCGNDLDPVVDGDDTACIEKTDNYDIKRNIFANNSMPDFSAGATPNLLVNTGSVTTTNHPSNIHIEENYFYLTHASSGIAGMTIGNSHDVTIKNNHIFKGTYAAALYGNNRGIKFTNNFYWGKMLLVGISNTDYISPGSGWNIDKNVYFQCSGLAGKMYGHSIDPEIRYYWSQDPLAPEYPDSFQGLYHDDLNSCKTNIFYINENDPGHIPNVLYFNEQYIAPKYMITQNKYTPNVFYVAAFDPDVFHSNSVDVDFSHYGIPPGTPFTVKYAQDYYGPDVSMPSNILPGNGQITFALNGTAFEQLPPYPNQFLSQPMRTAEDFDIFVVRFGCSTLDDLWIHDQTDGTTLPPYVAGNTIRFGPNYNTEDPGNVEAKAGNLITLTANTHLKSDSFFHAYIEESPCGSLAYVGEDPVNIVPDCNDDRPAPEKADLFRIHPNPSNGIFKIESLLERKIVHVTILRVDTGRTVFNLDGNDKIFDANIAKEPEGLYAVKVTFDDHTSDVKTVIKK